MKKRWFPSLAILSAVLLYSCAPELISVVPNPDETSASTNMDKLTIPASFNFNTADEVKFDVGTFDNSDSPIKGVVVSVYSYPENELLLRGVTSTNGILSITQKIPSYIKKVSIRTEFIGLPSELVTEVSNGKVQITFGGKDPKVYGNIIDVTSARATSYAGARAVAQEYPPIAYMGKWSSSGVPEYLESKRDVLTAEFLQNINASVPEGNPVPTAHPDYLNTSNRNWLYIKELADVWITFVHEGAGWLNTLGYYTFDPKSPPTKPSDISKINIIFPNVSFSGSGGGLVSGDKVKLGRFPEGTGIGFVLFGNAFSNNTVGKGYYAHYSHDALNIETKSSLRRHLIVLNDPVTQRMVLSFEDVSRENTPINCDNDFNDAIFFATSNPVKAIDTENIPIVDSATDTDGDGVGDTRDEYPKDPTRAINNYTPSKSTYSTLAYEDLWPSQGDYDLNDLVVNYQFQEVLNAKNQVVELKAKAFVKAIGASFVSGWGFELPVEPSSVKTVSGYSLTDGKIKLAANGVEAEQKYATVIAFDNAYKQMKASAGFINTIQGSKLVGPADTLRLNIVFTSPVDKSKLGSAPYNAFLFRGDDRGKEVHLPNQAPTSKANLGLFGTAQDRSSVSKNIYYKNAKGLPWAVSFPTDFRYPVETKAIIDAYTKFAEWAESGGTKYQDWYLQKTGYTVEDKIFSGK